MIKVNLAIPPTVINADVKLIRIVVAKRRTQKKVFVRIVVRF